MQAIVYSLCDSVMQASLKLGELKHAWF